MESLLSAAAAPFEGYDSEVVRCIQFLKSKRDLVQQQILREEDDRNKLHREIQILSARLDHLNESIAFKTQAKQDYDATIAETETAYAKIVESAQTLVHVLKRESNLLEQRFPGGEALPARQPTRQAWRPATPR